MALRSTLEAIDDLRQLLKDLEGPKASDCDPVALNDLKHIVLNRIAELEAGAARELRTAKLRPTPQATDTRICSLGRCASGAPCFSPRTVKRVINEREFISDTRNACRLSLTTAFSQMSGQTSLESSSGTIWEPEGVSMAARVIHFGQDDCSRVQVLRSAGYEVREAGSLRDLSFDLQCDEHVDAVVVSEDYRRTAEQAAAVVRQHSTAPLILFRRFFDGLDESQFDRVFSPLMPPEKWLLGTAELIAVSRAIGQQSGNLTLGSADLRLIAPNFAGLPSFRRASIKSPPKSRYLMYNSVESPRAAAWELDQSTGPTNDEVTLAGVKRILENHIAALEILQALSAEVHHPRGTSPQA
jgi:hypothetical protein